MENPYYLASRFPSEKIAGEVYFPLQQFIYEVKDECDLSVYRFKSQQEGKWYVVVIGERPPESLHVEIEARLTNGTPVTLDEEVLMYLMGRREQAIQFGPWVEVHYPYEEEK